MADPKLPGIYAIRNSVNGRLYVGSAVNLASRWRTHSSQLARGIHPAALLQADWTTHGPAAFTFSIIELVSNRESLISREQHWLDILDGTNGYNTCPVAGSRFGSKSSPETRAKLSAMMKARTPVPDLGARISAGKMGHAVSPEARAKIGAAHKGKKLTIEHRRRITEFLTGRTPSVDTRAKIAAALKGPTTPEWRAKISRANKGRVISAAWRAKLSEGMKASWIRRRSLTQREGIQSE